LLKSEDDSLDYNLAFPEARYGCPYIGHWIFDGVEAENTSQSRVGGVRLGDMDVDNHLGILMSQLPQAILWYLNRVDLPLGLIQWDSGRGVVLLPSHLR
jgi:hypothetical protein